MVGHTEEEDIPASSYRREVRGNEIVYPPSQVLQLPGLRFGRGVALGRRFIRNFCLHPHSQRVVEDELRNDGLSMRRET